MQIEATNIDNVTYYSATVRGVQYTLHNTGLEWELHSKRLSLGPRTVGSYKFFLTLQALEEKMKAFRGISALIH